MWRVDDEAFDWFVLREGRYEKLEPADTILKSPTFPGLYLDMEALLGGDMRKVLNVLQEGIGSKEHEKLIGELEARAKD